MATGTEFKEKINSSRWDKFVKISPFIAIAVVLLFVLAWFLVPRYDYVLFSRAAEIWVSDINKNIEFNGDIENITYHPDSNNTIFTIVQTGENPASGNVVVTSLKGDKTKDFQTGDFVLVKGKWKASEFVQGSYTFDADDIS